MRLNPKHVFVPLVVLVMAVVLLSLRTAAEASCADAEAHLAKGAVAEAEKSLTAILRADPENSCARSAMADLAETRCRDADAARKAGLFTQALTGYKAVLATRPAEACAHAGVGGIVAALCQRAAFLVKHGAREAAKKAYTAITAIEPLPEPECSARGLGEPAPAPGAPGQTVVPGGSG